MRFPAINVLETIVGGLLIVLGMAYMYAQSQSVDKLTNIVNEAMIKDEHIYQQNNSVNINKISDDELYAVMMGYREYPIFIDGVSISTDSNDFDYYSSLIKEGYYTKSYQCDSNNNITQIIYTYVGATQMTQKE